MANADKIIAGLNEAIAFTKMSRQMVIRGYEQAMEEIGREGDYRGKDWSEVYDFLKSRLAQFKAEPSNKCERG